MEEPTVQLHIQRVVGRIAIDHAGARRTALLTLRRGKPVRHFHPREVTVLEHGARTRGHVVEDRCDEVPSGSPAATVECGTHPGRGGVLGLHGAGHGADRPELPAGAERHVEGSLVASHAWRTHVPQDTIVESVGADHRDGARSDYPATPVDHHPHRPLLAMTAPGAVRGTHRRIRGQPRGPAEQDGCPRPLHPGRVAGVVDVDTGVDRAQLTPAQQASDLVRLDLEDPQLGARDDAGPGGEGGSDQLHAVHPRPARGLGATAADAPVENEIVEPRCR